MASILHGNATTTPKIRKEIQNSTKSIAELAMQYGLILKLLLNGNTEPLSKIKKRDLKRVKVL